METKLIVSVSNSTLDVDSLARLGSVWVGQWRGRP